MTKRTRRLTPYGAILRAYHVRMVLPRLRDELKQTNGTRHGRHLTFVSRQQYEQIRRWKVLDNALMLATVITTNPPLDPRVFHRFWAIYQSIFTCPSKEPRQ